MISRLCNSSSDSLHLQAFLVTESLQDQKHSAIQARQSGGIPLFLFSPTGIIVFLKYPYALGRKYD